LAAYVFGAAAADKAAVLLVAEIDPEAIPFTEVGGRFAAELDSYAVVASRDTGQNHAQEKEIALGLPPEVRSRLARTWLPVYRDFELPPGTYQARFLVRERRSGRMGTVRHAFEVPPPDRFRVSTPILTDSLQADPKAGPRPVPLARRSFPPGASLAYLFEVYGAASDGGGPRVVSRYEVRRADGSTLVRAEPSPIEPGPQGQLSRQVAVSLQGAPAGDYEIVLTVEDRVSGRTLEVRDPFTVAGPPPASPASGRP
jgi:hypothetical protein